jgi:hypothetical protein
MPSRRTSGFASAAPVDEGELDGGAFRRVGVLDEAPPILDVEVVVLAGEELSKAESKACRSSSRVSALSLIVGRGEASPGPAGEGPSVSPST